MHFMKSRNKLNRKRGIPMPQTGYTYFVENPRILADLMKPHLLEQERPFEVVKTVKLRAIDYENFATDMVADRQFIEDNADLCSKGTVWKCILVQKRGNHDGILVMPEGRCYVGYAAYFTLV